MPFLKIDVIEGRNQEEIDTLLDAIHEAVLEAFKVPEGDRYQILSEHPKTHMRFEDTGLGFSRTDKVVFIHVTTRPRPRDQKETFYRLVAEKLADGCGIEDTDVMVSLVENGDEDWSFAHGRAQFLTGEL